MRAVKARERTALTRRAALGALLGIIGCSSNSHRPLRIERVEDLGPLSLPSSHVLGRDGSDSRVFGDRVVWTFGDTFLDEPNGIDGSSVLSATAGWSSVRSPLTLQEPLSDAGVPSQLIPYTDEELAQNQADPLNGWALWPGAVIDTGDASAVVLFQRIRRQSGSGFYAVSVNTARLELGATAASRDPEPLFVGSMLDDGGTRDGGEPLFGGSGAVSVIDGTAYLLACENTGPFEQQCRIARVPASQIAQRRAYAYFDGSSWQPDLARAALAIPHSSAGASISRNAFLGRYLMVQNRLLSNDVILRTADQIEGPWSDEDGSISPSDGGVLAPVDGALDYLAHEHPELDSADGRSIVISYSRPTGPFRGEVRLARITFGE